MQKDGGQMGGLPNAAQVVLYNCKRCKTGRRVEYPETYQGSALARKLYFRRDESGKQVVPGVWIERSGGGKPTVYGGDPLGVCSACNRMMAYGVVKGIFKPDHKCDVRCTSARGHNCECACGGENHGADWSSVGLTAEAA